MMWTRQQNRKNDIHALAEMKGVAWGGVAFAEEEDEPELDEEEEGREDEDEELEDGLAAEDDEPEDGLAADEEEPDGRLLLLEPGGREEEDTALGSDGMMDEKTFQCV